MAHGRGYGGCTETLPDVYLEVLYCLHYAAMPERKRIQDLTMTG